MSHKNQNKSTENFIRNTYGKNLPVDIHTYNKNRPRNAVSTFRTLCHAPFVSMDFSPLGQITVCNHYHKVIANLSDKGSFLDIWNGETYRKLRENMLNYTIDEDLCRHCAKQIRTGSPENAFSLEQYDKIPSMTEHPEYPALMTFRLANTCNLACIMCTGHLSSRICREREKRKNPPSPYGEKFFSDLRKILPKLRHVEFFGGEPFLVKAHLRIFEMMKTDGIQCSIYVNTNAMSLNEKIKEYLETLNFTCIAVSMDGVNEAVNQKIRLGINQKRFLKNLDWYLNLRTRKPVFIMLNVTELRQNWFELPQLFRFAAEKDCYLHINTCIHPSYCTLYDLPTNQLSHVFEFLNVQKLELGRALQVKGNRQSYAHLLSMIRTELESRSSKPSPDDPAELDISRYGTDGMLAAPIPGVPPFETPEKVLSEIQRIQKNLPQTGQRLITSMVQEIHNMPDNDRRKNFLAMIDQMQDIT